jgi:Tfp pilus assembly protein PilE
MKRIKLLGVTLLEVMLVLAVASVIILMSVRFYKSATDSSQVNSYMQSVQAITAAADGLAQNSGSYAAASNTAIIAIVGSKAMVAPWGATIAVAPAGTTGITITPTPTGGTSVCKQVETKLQTNPKYSGTGCVVTYTATN